jgi:hypothetical protein
MLTVIIVALIIWLAFSFKLSVKPPPTNPIAKPAKPDRVYIYLLAIWLGSLLLYWIE